MLASLSKTKQAVRSLKIDKFVYPEKIMTQLIEEQKYPKCIFIPDTKVLRKMIRAVVKR